MFTIAICCAVVYCQALGQSVSILPVLLVKMLNFCVTLQVLFSERFMQSVVFLYSKYLTSLGNNTPSIYNFHYTCLIFSSSVVQMKFKTSEVYLLVGLAQNFSVKWIISVAVTDFPSPETLSRCHTPISGGCGLDPLHGQLGFVPVSTLADPGKRSKASLWSPSSSFQCLGWPVACTASAAEAGGKNIWGWSQAPHWSTLGACLLPSDISHSVGNGPWDKSTR